MINHRGIVLTSRLTDLSGYLILVVAAVLTLALLAFGIAPGGFPSRSGFTVNNYSGLPSGDTLFGREPRTSFGSSRWVSSCRPTR